MASLKGHSASVFSAVFSGDDKLVATASQDGTARIWDTKTGKLLATLRGAGGPIYSANFSPDGRKLVTASQDRLARIYSTNVEDYLRMGWQILRYQPEYKDVKDFCEPCLAGR